MPEESIDIIIKQGDAAVMQKEKECRNSQGPFYQFSNDWGFFKTKYMEGRADRALLEEFIKTLKEYSCEDLTELYFSNLRDGFELISCKCDTERGGIWTVLM